MTYKSMNMECDIIARCSSGFRNALMTCGTGIILISDSFTLILLIFYFVLHQILGFMCLISNFSPTNTIHLKKSTSYKN